MGDAHASRFGRPVCAFFVTVKDGVAEVVFDLPGEKVNILSGTVMEELNRTLLDLSERKDVACLVVKSGKPGNFIGGADMHEFLAVPDAKTAAEKAGGGQAVFNLLDDLPFPTIAAIHGAAVGGGLELALACDYRVVTDDPRTKLSLPETTIGILPGFGGTWRLPRIVGLTAALRMILTGSPVDGPRAEKMGLADACWPAAFFEEKTMRMARQLAGGKPTGVKGNPRGTAARNPRGTAARRRKRRLGTALAEGTPLGRALLFRAARRDVLARTGGHYPAPLAALHVLRQTVHAGRDKALALERETVGSLLPTEITRNLVRLFFAQEAAKKPAALAAGAAAVAPSAAAPGSAPRRIERAAVLGAGVMGGRIAWFFARQGVPVVVKDIAWEPVCKGFETAHSIFRELEAKRRGSPRETSLGMNRLSGAVDYKSVGSPDLVIEAVVENLAVKKKVLAEVEEHVRADTLLASNTSSLSITEMASALRSPERFVGMHFFNPPNRMPLVEVVPGARTSPHAVAEAVRAALFLGKTPVVVRDCPGFLVNRLLMPYLNECVRLIEEGSDFAAVDRLFLEFGMPMGPFTLLDEIGIDVAREVGRVLSAAYGNRMEASAIIESLAGRPDLLGKKTGRGFYLHEGGKRVPNPEMRRLISERRNAAVHGDRGDRREAPGPDEARDRPLLAMVNEAARALQEGVVASAQEADLALILGTGFPPFRGGLLRWADSRGIASVHRILGELAASRGARFTPAPLIETLASQGKGFYSD